jgi:hypothetical protein
MFNRELEKQRLLRLIEDSGPISREVLIKFLKLNVRGDILAHEEMVQVLKNFKERLPSPADIAYSVEQEPRAFELLALIVPLRVYEEEVTDALEVLHTLKASGAPLWKYRLKISTTFCWALVNAIREVVSAVTGQARQGGK